MTHNEGDGKTRQVVEGEDTDRVLDVLREKDNIIEQLRADNEDTRTKVSQLEMEITVLKAKKESAPPAAQSATARLNSLQLEENLKRERQAAQAIAQHDMAVIKQLEKEIERLNSQHESDSALVAECADRVASLMQSLEEQQQEVRKKHLALTDAHHQIEILQDRIAKQEVLLLNQARSPPAYTPPSLISNSHGSPNTRPIRSTSPIASPPHRSSPLSSSRYSPSTVPKPAPKLGTPFMFSESRASASAAKSSHNTPPPPPPPQISLKQDTVHHDLTELEQLRNENEVLRTQLETERTALRNQMKTLERVRTSAEEITLLEAEEIARLEHELEKAKEEAEKWKMRSQKYESQCSVLRQQLMEAQSNAHNMKSRSHLEQYKLQPNVKTQSNGMRETVIIEMYRKREIELLEALEGLVKRCQELEYQLIEHFVI